MLDKKELLTMKLSSDSVLLVSIDALKPEFVLEQERLGIHLPNLYHHFIKNGAFASKGIKSVFPSFTYACHQSMITGTYPDTHGTYNNIIFDPEGAHKGAWHWFVSETVPTLWKLAKDNGYCSATVAFPTSAGAQGDYVIPEFWWDGTELDSRFIAGLSHPQGLVHEMEKDLGSFPSGLDLTLEGDRKRKACTSWLLNKKLRTELNSKPFFLSTYFASYDEMAHVHGVYSKEAMETLQQIDTLLGELINETLDVTSGNVIICVVSDHGTIDNKFCINPNVLLHKAGLITLDDNQKLYEWKAWSQRAGGTCEIRLKDPSDDKTSSIVASLLGDLCSDEESGIFEVLTGEQARINRKGFSKADFVLIAEKGYEIRDNIIGDYLTTDLAQKAQHGYNEDFEEMRASFYIAGNGIPHGHDIGSANLIDIAPTLAKIMGFQMPSSEGRDLCFDIGLER